MLNVVNDVSLNAYPSMDERIESRGIVTLVSEEQPKNDDDPIVLICGLRISVESFVQCSNDDVEIFSMFGPKYISSNCEQCEKIVDGTL